jgi:hypothetical protein
MAAMPNRHLTFLAGFRHKVKVNILVPPAQNTQGAQGVPATAAPQLLHVEKDFAGIAVL